VRIRGRLLIVAVAAAAMLALPAIAQARSLKVVDANVHEALAKDASLLVTEDLTWKIEGTYEAAYRDIPLREGEKITDVQVSENGKPYDPGGATAYGSHDRPGVFGVTSIPGGARIVWHYAATDETRTWSVSYRMIGEAAAYDDVIDVNYKVWGDQWAFTLPSLHADFTNPALQTSNNLYRVWGHPRDVEGKTSREEGVAKLDASDIPDHQWVELRVTIPRTPGQGVSGARVKQGEGLPGILAEEKGADDNFNKPWNKAKRWIGHNAVALALALLALGIAVMALLRFAALEHKVSTPKYLPEPPDDAPPALAYGLAHEGSDSANTVLATLLDLTDRGFYDTKTEAAKKEKLDLSISKAAKRPSAEKLTVYEQTVLGFFDELLGEDTVVMSEMKDRVPEHSSTWRAKWEGMTSALNAADEGQLNWDRKLGKYQGLTLLGIAVLGAVVAICSSLVEHTLWLPLVICGVAFLLVAVLGGNSIKRLDKASRERQS
jgi:uncharacterized membrane protein